MSKKNVDIIEGYKKKIKRQNEHIKQNYDKITITVPKGIKERIKSHTNLSLNAYMLQLIKNDLPDEEQQKQTEQSEQPQTQVKEWVEPVFTYDEYGNAYCEDCGDELPFG